MTETALQKNQVTELTFHENFPALAALWEAWWQRENDSPLVYSYRARPDAAARGVPQGKHFELMRDPAEWVKVREAQLRDEIREGDATPFIRVDLGPVAIGAFLGAPLEIAEKENTTWQRPIIQDWDDLPALELREDNEWWQRVQATTHELARRAAGNYLVCLPDLSGPTDILANLRGSQELCLDLFEEREKILAVSDRLAEIWSAVYKRLYSIIHQAGASGIHWLGLWSDKPYTVPTCDFNALIGPNDYRELCLPAYRKQARLAGRVCVHLDGPDASRHAPALAETPEFSAVQYTPGAGTPSALAKLEMFHMLQDAGKPLVIFAPTDEVPELTRKLNPRGLAIWAQ